MVLSRAKHLVKIVMRELLGPHGSKHVAFAIRHPTYYPGLRKHLSIEGWLGYAEAVNLYRLSLSLPSAPCIVEIGSWQGKSSVVLGKGVASKHGAKVYCIEPFTGDGVSHAGTLLSQLKQSQGLLLREAFDRNIVRNALQHVVHVVPGYSHDVVRDWRGDIHLLFIDGDHRYEAVRQDFLDWTPFLVHGGYVVLDDVAEADGQKSGPARVVNEHIERSYEWCDTYQVGRHFVARKV